MGKYGDLILCVFAMQIKQAFEFGLLLILYYGFGAD
jgi:hypothetical protein